MNGKRLLVFVLLVVVLLGTAGATTPYLAKNIRLGLDLKGGFEILYVASPIEQGGTITKESLRETANALEQRVNKQGVSEPDIATEGTDRIRVRLAGVSDPEKVREILKKPAELTFRGPDGTVELKGNDFVPGGASVQYETGNRPIIQIKLKSASKMKEVTTKLMGKTLAIYLDEDQLSNPTVNSVIDSDTAVITGNFTFTEANNLKNTINLGALPLKLTEKYTQQVDATLGQQSLQDTINAGLIALVLILGFMIVYYRIPGLVAVITILVYSWLLMLVFVLMNVVLTLPGIAAFVLGIGMAVDANIITYERIKEEIRSGKSLLSSLRSGSKHSFRTIMDANITNVIAAVVLYSFGNGGIRGFALTTIISIVLSVLTNVFLSRLLISLLVRSNTLKKPSYYGVKEADIRDL